MSAPSFRIERQHWNKNHLVIGIDEVGRGALAGPLTVGAVCFDPRSQRTASRQGINDSKIVSASKRVILAEYIKTHAQAYSIASCSVDHINTHGITHATISLIQILFDELREKLPPSIPVIILLDGLFRPKLKGVAHSSVVNIIDGDALSISIAAASIIAKVDRDQQMVTMAPTYPRYRWDQNKGYGTLQHRWAIKHYGPCPVHRKLFIRSLI